MSTSEPGGPANDFESWLKSEYEEEGSFTALIVLVQIREISVTLLCSTHVNVIGPEVAWGDLVVMFAGAGHEWDGAAFFPRQDPDGHPLDNPTARVVLRDLERSLDEDRLVLNQGQFFDRWGRRMKIEELTAQ